MEYYIKWIFASRWTFQASCLLIMSEIFNMNLHERLNNKNVTRTFLLRKTLGPDLTLLNTFMSIFNERPTKFVIFCQIQSINRENTTSITNMTESTFKFSICDLGFKGLVNYICWNCGNFMIFPSCKGKAFQNHFCYLSD